MAAAVLAGVWLTAGCATGGAPGIVETASDPARLDSDQLQAVVVSYASEFATTVAAAADEVAGTTADPQIRRQTLIWKATIVPQVYVVASAPDPALSLVDLWTLAVQQRDLLAGPAGAAALGSGHAAAAVAADRLVSRARRLVELTLTTDEAVHRIATIVETFAAQHPMRDFGFVRESIVPDYAHLLRAPDGLLGEIEAAGDTAGMAAAIALAALRDGPALVRWQMEIAVMDASRSPLVSGMAQSVDQLSGAAVGIGDLAGALPAVIAHERAAAFEDIDRLQDATVREVEIMRVDTIGALSRERQIVIDALRAERDIVLSALHAELGRMIATASSERAAFTHDLSRVIGRAEEGVAHDVRDLVDHAFTRLVQLLLGLAVLALLALGVWRLVHREHRRLSMPQGG